MKIPRKKQSMKAIINPLKGIGIYRESTPKGAQEVIDDMKADGTYDQDLVDEEIELANHWATIGLGKQNYYS